MAKKGFRFPIRFKTAALIIVFGIILTSIGMVYFSVVTNSRNQENYKAMATELSNTVALTLDRQKVSNVKNAVYEIYDHSEKPVREEHEGTPELAAYLALFEPVKQSQDYKDIQATLNAVKKANTDTDGIYVAFVDYARKLSVYMVYDQESEAFPVGIIDPIYEEDYPLIENPKLGFVASIYYSEYDHCTMVTAGAPVLNEAGEVICYCLVDVTMEVVNRKFTDSVLQMLVYMLSTLAILVATGILVIHFMLVKPVATLQKAALSYDVKQMEETHDTFTRLNITTHDEFADLAGSMKRIEGDVYNKMNELTAINRELDQSHLETQKMTELASKDALTGVKNKIAYDNEVALLDEAIVNGEVEPFGLAMIDLNYLKEINDEYGHDSGDVALIKLCTTICTIFAHSPVYRVGGDEFVVILRGRDYEHASSLIKEFNAKVERLAEEEELRPERSPMPRLAIAPMSLLRTPAWTTCSAARTKRCTPVSGR